jgi:hypothetical protein
LAFFIQSTLITLKAETFIFCGIEASCSAYTINKELVRYSNNTGTVFIKISILGKKLEVWDI